MPRPAWLMGIFTARSAPLASAVKSDVVHLRRVQSHDRHLAAVLFLQDEGLFQRVIVRFAEFEPEEFRIQRLAIGGHVEFFHRVRHHFE